MVKWWEVFADPSGALIFQRCQQGHSSYQCSAALISPQGQPVRGTWRVPVLGLPDGLNVVRWAVVD